jgi:hypothetical protein
MTAVTREVRIQVIADNQKNVRTFTGMEEDAPEESQQTNEMEF